MGALFRDIKTKVKMYLTKSVYICIYVYIYINAHTHVCVLTLMYIRAHECVRGHALAYMECAESCVYTIRVYTMYVCCIKLMCIVDTRNSMRVHMSCIQLMYIYIRVYSNSIRVYTMYVCCIQLMCTRIESSRECLLYT